MTLHNLWRALFWLWTGAEVVLVLVTRTRRSSGQTRDRGSILILWPTIFLSIWFALDYGYTHTVTIFPGHRGPFYLALALFIAGLLIRWTAIFSLGRSFSVNVAIRDTQTVYREGLYRIVRHPSYTGMLLIFAGIGLETRNWVSLAIMLIFPTAALLYRIHVEEDALNQAFGAEYGEYSRSTKRLIPGIY